MNINTTDTTPTPKDYDNALDIFSLEKRYDKHTYTKEENIVLFNAILAFVIRYRAHIEYYGLEEFLTKFAETYVKDGLNAALDNVIMKG